MNARRWFAALAALLVLAILGLVVALLGSLDAIVERGIEEHGTRLAGARVSVDDVEIDLTEGSGTVRGLRVANPKGFSRDEAIRLEAITLEIDLGSLGSSPLGIDLVDVGEVEIRLEVDEAAQTNLDALRRNVEGQPADSDEDAGGTDPEGEQRFRIRRLQIAGGQILTIGPHTEGEERSVPFPGLAMKDLGGARGATAGALGKEILLAFTRRVTATVARSELLDTIEKELGDAAGSAADAADGLLRKVFD